MPSEFDDQYDHMEETRRAMKLRWRKEHPDDPLGNNDRVTVENDAGTRVMFNVGYFHDALRANVGDEVLAKTSDIEARELKHAGLTPGTAYRVVQIDEFPTNRAIVRDALRGGPPPEMPEMLPMEGLMVRIRNGDRIVAVHSDMLAIVTRPKPGDTVRLAEVMLPDAREHALAEGLDPDMPYDVVSVG